MLRRTRHILVLSVLVIFISLLFLTQYHEPVKSYYNSISFLPSSSSSNSVPCPSIYEQGPLPAVDHSKQTCSPISSRLDEFNTELCLNPNGRCNEFTLRISRVSSSVCSELEKGPDPSFLDEVNKWMRKERGPDSFYIRTDGAQRAAFVLANYEGGCRYRFDIQLKNPGLVWLSGWWTQTRYEGFSETNMTWPEMNLFPLFNPIHLNTCSPLCAASQQYAPPLNRHITNLNTSLYSGTFDTLPELPPCNPASPEPVEGIYIPTHPLDVLYPPYPIHQPIEIPTMNRYTFHPLGCRWDHGGLRFSGWDKFGEGIGIGADWSPYAPSHQVPAHTVPPKNTTEEGKEKFGIEKCLSHGRKKLFFIGDSHGRVLYDAVSHRLTQLYLLRQSITSPRPEGVEVWVPEVMRESEKVGSKHSRVPPEDAPTTPDTSLNGTIELEFSWDPRGLEFLFSEPSERCAKIAHSDVIITSLGSHWANVNQSTYENEIPQILNAIMDCETTQDGGDPSLATRKYLFVTLPAGPPRTDEWTREFNDHRTNVRSAYQAGWALDLLLSPSSSQLSSSTLEGDASSHVSSSSHNKSAHGGGGGESEPPAQWSAINFFSHTLPFNLESLSVDLAHYLLNDALEGVVDEVIGKAGICE